MKAKEQQEKKVRVKALNPEYDPANEREDVPKEIDVLAEPDELPKKCWNCDGLSRERNNHAWACRRHKGNFTEDLSYRGSGPRPGVWSCCGREAKDEPGCCFQGHNYQ